MSEARMQQLAQIVTQQGGEIERLRGVIRKLRDINNACTFKAKAAWDAETERLIRGDADVET